MGPRWAGRTVLRTARLLRSRGRPRHNWWARHTSPDARTVVMTSSPGDDQAALWDVAWAIRGPNVGRRVGRPRLSQVVMRHHSRGANRTKGLPTRRLWRDTPAF